MPPAVDSHVHLWDLDRFDYPWLEADECAPIRANYVAADLAADMSGTDVEAIVHVQAEVDHAVDPVEETAWLTSIVEAAPAGFPAVVCVGYADLRAADLEDVLERHRQYERVRGIRQELWFDPASAEPGALSVDLMADPAWRTGLAALARHGLSFDVLVSAAQLDRARAVFREHPDLPVVLDHTGIPTLVDGAPPPEWRSGLARFAAEVPHSFLKVSAMGFIQSSWRTEEIAPIVRESIEIFGPARCMLGSNYPVEKPDAAYADVWRAYDEITGDLSSGERGALFSGTARRAYRIAESAA